MCLRRQLALRIWDRLLLDGTVTLFQTALAILKLCEKRLVAITDSNIFYTAMLRAPTEAARHPTKLLDVRAVVAPATAPVSNKLMADAPHPLLSSSGNACTGLTRWRWTGRWRLHQLPWTSCGCCASPRQRWSWPSGRWPVWRATPRCR